MENQKALEIAEQLSADLEDANYHDMVGVPEEIYYAIRKVIDDEAVIDAIFQQIKQDRIFYK